MLRGSPLLVSGRSELGKRVPQVPVLGTWALGLPFSVSALAASLQMSGLRRKGAGVYLNPA